jgi:hypothetical protein
MEHVYERNEQIFIAFIYQNWAGKSSSHCDHFDIRNDMSVCVLLQVCHYKVCLELMKFANVSRIVTIDENNHETIRVIMWHAINSICLASIENFECKNYFIMAMSQIIDEYCESSRYALIGNVQLDFLCIWCYWTAWITSQLNSDVKHSRILNV